jgi:hypothetical protein
MDHSLILRFLRFLLLIHLPFQAYGSTEVRGEPLFVRTGGSESASPWGRSLRLLKEYLNESPDLPNPKPESDPQKISGPLFGNH